MTQRSLWKKPGPKGQRESRVQSRDATGRERRFAHEHLAAAMARLMLPKKIA